MVALMCDNESAAHPSAPPLTRMGLGSPARLRELRVNQLHLLLFGAPREPAPLAAIRGSA